MTVVWTEMAAILMLFAPGAVTCRPAIPYLWQVSRMGPARQIDQNEKEIGDENSSASFSGSPTCGSFHVLCAKRGRRGTSYQQG
jgi:hypothetical protein